MALGDLAERVQKLSPTQGFELRTVQSGAGPYTGRPSSTVHITLMERDLHPLYRRLSGARGPVRTGTKIIAHTRFRTADRSARSGSLYRSPFLYGAYHTNVKLFRVSTVPITIVLFTLFVYFL